MPSFFLFILIYFLSFMYVLCIDDWILVWFGMELNMMSYIVLIYKRYSILVMESCLKYFIIQSLGSAIFLMMIYSNFIEVSLVSFILSYKLGVGPFYYWFPSLCSGLNWIACFYLMTIQKIIPLFLLSMFTNKFMWFIIIISLLVGIFGAFNQVDIKQLLAYSSIHHVGWIMYLFYSKDMLWMWYLLIYFMILMNIFIFLMKYDIFIISILMSCKNIFWFMVGILSLGGLPPFLGFFLKWIAFYYIIDVSLLIMVFLIFISVGMLYIYMRMLYDMLMLNSINMGFLSQHASQSWIFMFDCLNMFGFVLGIMLSLLIMM
uniref:NADH-ubiquinone oxidoreductase chain 2 n=1 Tax=Philodromus sp. TaxID=2975155 RepID=A0A977LJ30_9ARAC|nr:NADH dehydrogenase subunit 2 [Philodromus sp.]